MKSSYGGPMPVKDMFQAIWQDKENFSRHNIQHVRDVYLYFTPCDKHGEPVVVCDQIGNIIERFQSPGAYHCAADAYDRQQELESQPVTRQQSPMNVPFSPL